MNEEIKQLNDWIDNQISNSEKEFGENDWRIKYYNKFKDIDKLEGFIVGSGDLYNNNNCLGRYITTHRDEYDLFPSTGSCIYIKKKVDSE